MTQLDDLCVSRMFSNCQYDIEPLHLYLQVTEKIEAQLRDRLPEVSGAACLTISALKGHGLESILPTAINSYTTWNQRVTTGRLNSWLADVRPIGTPAFLRSLETKFDPYSFDFFWDEFPSPTRQYSAQSVAAIECSLIQPADVFVEMDCTLQVAKQYEIGGGATQISRLKYVTQVTARPPKFVAFLSGTQPFPDSASKFFSNALREEFGFEGVPLRIEVRKNEDRRSPTSRARLKT